MKSTVNLIRVVPVQLKSRPKTRPKIQVRLNTLVNKVILSTVHLKIYSQNPLVGIFVKLVNFNYFFTEKN